MAEDENLVVDLTPDEEAPPPTSSTSSTSSDDDKPAVAAKPPPVPGPSAAPAPQVGLADLQRQMQAERTERARVTEDNRRLSAERDQAIAFAQEAERRGVSTYELYNENRIKATQDQMVALAQAGEVALQDGDFKRAQALNLEMGRLGGTLAVMERDQSVLVQQREQNERQPAPAPQSQPVAGRAQQQVPTDPLERAIMNRTEPTKVFLRKHPEIVRDDGTFKRYAIEAHERARDAGYAVDTPAYFDFIERSIVAQTPSQDGQPLPRGYPTTAAPVARNGGPGGSGGSAASGNFTMTPKMRRLAEEQGVTPKEWAQNYVRLLNEGRITPIV